MNNMVSNSIYTELLSELNWGVAAQGQILHRWIVGFVWPQFAARGRAKSSIIKDAWCERASADFFFFFICFCTCFHHTCTDTHAHMLSEAQVRGSVTVRWRRPFIVASNFLPLYFEMVNLWTMHAAHVCHFGGFFSGGNSFLFLILSAHFQSWRGEARPRARRM